MAMKDISDRQVCAAILAYKIRRADVRRDKTSEIVPFPYELLSAATGQPEKVCFRAMERACNRGLIEYGVSLRTGWLTEDGEALLRACAPETIPTTRRESRAGGAS